MARIRVHLTPRGGRDAIEGWSGGSSADATLRVRVAAPPVEGAANEALIRLIARALDVPKSAIRLTAGAQSRNKVIEIEGRTLTEIEARVAALATSNAGG